MNVTIRHLRIGKQDVRKTVGNGVMHRRPNGSGRIFRCACCQRRLICCKLGTQYLCVECRGGQGL